MRRSHRSTWFLISGLAITIVLATANVMPTRASITPGGQQGCAVGTVVGGPNLVVNGDFAQGSFGFTSQIPDRGQGPDGTGVEPDDYGDGTVKGGFSIQKGPKEYGKFVTGKPFPGDPQRAVPASETYYYSNVHTDTQGNMLYGEGTAGRALLWRQEVTVVENTTYNFFAYFDNLINVDNGFFVDPRIELLVDGIAAGQPVVVKKFPDTWLPIQYTFTTGPGQTRAVLEIYDLANNTSGDDFGMAQINLKQCVTGIGLAKAALPAVDNKDGTYTTEFIITVRNLGVDALPLSEVQITDDLAATFAEARSFSVVSLQSSSLTVNPAYNGTTDKRLLAGTDQLAARTSATVSLRVRVTPGLGAGGKGPFFNSASATARAGTLLVIDDSSPGGNPDPNGNGDPREPGEDRPTPIYLSGQPVYLPLLRR